MPDSREDDAASRRFGHYRVERRPDGAPWELGRGAMGVTYRAWDETLRVPVALKVITPGQVESPRAQALFLREARAAARVRHPNVASVLFLSAEPGNIFYAMELIEGEPLADWLRARPRPVPALVCQLGAELARGLGAIHAQGLIHRDLKPANVMLLRSNAGDDDGEAWTAKIIDFGLARAVAEGTPEGETLAQTTGFRGTVLYASPEQCEELPDLDGRSDLYSLGCILWQMLAGDPPFRGRSQRELMNQHLAAPPPRERLAHVPASLRDVVLRLLEKDREHRFPRAEVVARELERCRGEAAATPTPPLDATAVLEPTAPTQLDTAATETSAAPPAPVLAPTAPATAPRSRRGWTIAALLICLLGLAAFFFLPRGLSAERSVAVLPFENVGDDREEAFFADGLQDDVLASLAKIRDLAVVGRASVLPFRGANGPDRLREAGRALGVSHLLEGRVRRAGNRIVLNVALTEARTGRQTWAKRYDRTLADVLTLQGELAQEIAQALSATLSPEERAQVAVRPTANEDAYLIYLKARQADTAPGTTLANFQEAVRLYKEAVALDPAFALARARLASTLTYIFLNSEPSEAVRTRARAEAEEAVRLQPQLGPAHVARALCSYRIDRDYEAALRELEIAARLLPNDLDVESTVAYIHRRQGRWADAAAGLERVFARDVRNPVAAEEVFIVRTQQRRWAEAEQAGMKTLALTGPVPALSVQVAWVAWWAQGDLAPLRRALDAIPLTDDPDGAITLARWDAACLARDFAGAERAVAASQSALVLGNSGVPFSRNYLLGAAALGAGDAARARPLLEAARVEAEAEVRAVPDAPFRHAQLGLICAYLGRREEALRAGRRAVELAPIERDAFDGPCLLGALALICARVGETDEALALVERLLRTPAANLPWFEASITGADLRARWQWDGLRADPRFQRLASGG